jgi:hypothetical protein
MKLVYEIGCSMPSTLLKLAEKSSKMFEFSKMSLYESLAYAFLQSSADSYDSSITILSSHP